MPISHLRGVQRAFPQIVAQTGNFGHHPHRECRDRLWTFIELVCMSADVGPAPLAEIQATTPERAAHASGGAAPAFAAA